jgi:membrane protein implicated in regulation of membrane protease activity
MLQEFLDTGALNIVYAITVFVSFIFAVISLLGAEIGEAFDFDIDAGDGFDFINISPFSLAMFAASFGLIGLITRLWFEMESIPSILWSLGLGLLVGGAAQAFFIYVLSPTKSSHFSLSDDAIGREVEVIITIPSDGLGQIAYDNISGRVTLSARSVTGEQIERGKNVKIEKITGRTAFVQPVNNNE